MARPHDQPHDQPFDLGARPRILVVKLASLGDALLATPALRALRMRYPDARLDLLTTQAGATLLADSPLLDSITVFDKYAFDSPRDLLRRPQRLVGLLSLAARLRSERYDAALLLHHLTLRFGRFKYRALLAATGARLTVGLDNGHGGFLDARVPDDGFGARHEAAYMLAVAEAVGARLPEGARGLRVADLGWGDVRRAPDSATGKARAPGEGPLLALHPGGGTYSLARRWPTERFAELARALHRRFGARVVLIGGPEERELHAALLRALGAPPWAESRAGATTPRELARLLAECALLVGNDSLPAHLAAAVGTPVVAVFGLSNAAAWAPYAPDAPERVAVVRRDDLACSPCLYRGHALGTPEGCPERPCLTGLEVAPVLRAVERLLAEPAAHHASVG